MMKGVQLVFKNFEGRERKPYNEAGDRNFAVKLDDTTAENMLADGWPVRYLEPKEEEKAEGVTPQAILPVKVKYDGGPPPRVVMISNGTGRRKNLDESEVGDLDWVEIVNVDLTVRPWAWEFGGRAGIAIYLKTMYITIEEDPLDALYAEKQSATPEEAAAAPETA